MTRNIAHYEAAYLADYGFESVMVAYRRRLLIERLEKHRPRYVIEVGCGSELLYKDYLEHGGAVEQWLIVEPGSQFAQNARKAGLPNLSVIESFFEDATTQLEGNSLGPPDLVICSGVLHEVPEAVRLLRAIAGVMHPHTVLHVNVPNAGSLHRRLARSMGLTDDLTVMSARNRLLQQHRVYDRTSLTADLEKAGLSVVEAGGYLVKPFTHAQMEQIAAVLNREVLEGMFHLGKELPEIASEIFAEARRVAT